MNINKIEKFFTIFGKLFLGITTCFVFLFSCFAVTSIIQGKAKSTFDVLALLFGCALLFTMGVLMYKVWPKVVNHVFKNIKGES